jgi:hypothetical protein
MFKTTKIPAHQILAGTLVAVAFAAPAPAAVAADGPAYFPVNPEAGGLPPSLHVKFSTTGVASLGLGSDTQQYIQYETEGGVVRIPIASDKDIKMKKKE